MLCNACGNDTDDSCSCVWGGVATSALYINYSDGTTTTVDANADNSGTGWSYNAATATLTLDGFNGSYIEATDALNIVLKGTNKITPSSTNKYAIKANGVITIDKNSDNDTDKLIIENGSLNAAPFTAINGSGSGRYGDVLQRGGTVEIKLTNSINCGDSNFKGSTDYTISGNANLKINIENTVGGMIAAQYLKVSDSANVNITAKAAENKSVTAVDGLKVDGAGQVNITATATGGTATAIVVNNYGDIEPKNGGKVTVTGRVKTDYSSAYYYQPAGDTVVVNPAGQVRKSVGYGGTYCCDASGNPIESMTFTGTDNVKQQMQFNGESLFAIPDSTVGKFIGTHSLCEGISGRTFAYFKLVEGSAFPNGITLNENGLISGTPTTECDAGSVQIEARRYKDETKNTDIDKVVFTIKYGKVVNPPKYLTIGAAKHDMANNTSGTNWNYSATDNTLTLNGFNGTYIEADKEINIKLIGTNTITPNNDNQSAIKAKGVITINKNSNDETDKLIIENSSLNTAPFTAIVGSGSGRYGDVLQRGGTVEIELTNSINCGDSNFKGSTDYTISGNANLKIDIKNTEGGTIAVQYLKVSENADVDITAQTTAENKSITAVDGLKVDGAGQVNITATATGGTATAIVVNNYGDIEPKNGGKVTVTGRVKTDYSSSYYYQPASDTVIVEPAGQIRKSVGYNGTYCCDASGNPIESMTFTGTANVKQQMQFNGESLFAIPDSTVGKLISTHSLCEGISGRAFAYFKLKEGSAFPNGITLNENGLISGTPTAECDAGSVQIEARRNKNDEDNTDNDKVVFTIQYGAVTVSKPVTGVTLNETELILNMNEQKSLSATVQPEDATISTVSWNSDNSSIASVNTGVVTGHNPGKATVTVTTTQGAKKANATVYVKEQKPNASIDYVNKRITNLVNGKAYTISGTGITTETFTVSGNTHTIKDEWFDKTISLVLTNTEPKCNSDAQTLTIEKIEPQMLSFAQSSISKTYGDEPFTNAVTNKTTAGVDISDGGNIEWSSSDQNVAMVDGSGKVTIKKAGTTEIKAKAYAKGKYAEGIASYTLTVDKADPTYTVPTGLTGIKGNALSTVTLPSGWAWKTPATVMNTTGNQTFKAVYTPTDTTNYNTKEENLTVNVTESSSGGSGGAVIPPSGGGLIPAVQEPDITIIGSGKATLSTDGSTADIAADEGYELVSITVNGKEIANTDKLTGLKTGDKVVITFQKKSEEPTVDTKTIVDKVSKMKLTARSSKTAKKNIQITVNTDKETNNLIKEIKDLGYTVKYKYYRSTKKASKYTAKVEKNADINSYINISGKKGTKYYYKVRVMVYDADGNLVAKSDLKQCKYAARTWSK